MSCCCKPGRPDKASTMCLGRCDLPKHRCLEKDEVKPGPVPRNMGWLYTARDAPDFQQRCGWRPGHISCPVLRRIELHNCSKSGDCSGCASCAGSCTRPCPPRGCPRPCPPRACSRPCSRPCSRTCCNTPRCASVCPSSPSCCKLPCSGQPLIRIIRHNGQYQISTKPSNVSNSPYGPYPLKYVLNTGNEDTKEGKYSVEAKFNDYHFDYTSSQASFVLDFSPPVAPACYKKSVLCMLCQPDNCWPPAMRQEISNQTDKYKVDFKPSLPPPVLAQQK